jgi:hypothetical protein
VGNHNIKLKSNILGDSEVGEYIVKMIQIFGHSP